MECAAVPLAALSTGHKVGLVVAAAIFIGFALASALVIPRRQPDFPGRRLAPYVLATVLLLVGMMAAVFVFGKEEESEAQETPAGETTTGTTTQGPAGNPTAGRAAFLSSGCGACHAFKAAGASATIGPDLDTALQGKSAEFIHTSIVDPNAEIAKGYPRDVMPQNFGEQLSDKQLNDLVAFLQSG